MTSSNSSRFQSASGSSMFLRSILKGSTDSSSDSFDWLRQYRYSLDQRVRFSDEMFLNTDQYSVRRVSKGFESLNLSLERMRRQSLESQPEELEEIHEPFEGYRENEHLPFAERRKLFDEAEFTITRQTLLSEVLPEKPTNLAEERRALNEDWSHISVFSFTRR